MRNALRELDSVIERVRKRAQQPRDARLSRTSTIRNDRASFG
jgi:hypothetical protein